MAPEPAISTGVFTARLAASRARAMAGITRSWVEDANGWPSFSVSTSTNVFASRSTTSIESSTRALPGVRSGGAQEIVREAERILGETQRLHETGRRIGGAQRALL